MGDLADGPPVTDLRTENRRLAKHVAQLERELRVASSLRNFAAPIPAWTAPKRQPRGLTAAPLLLLSDLHFGETVDRRAMGGWNEYDDDIALARWERVIDQTAAMLERHAVGYRFPFMVIGLLGDILSGDIHDELAATNQMTTPVTVTTWVPRIAAGLRQLADTTGIERFVVPCVDGNHDRTGKPKTSKRRAESSWTWVIYQWIADKLADDDRFTFLVSHSSEVRLPVFDETFLFTHGDGMRGGSGIGGIFPPLMRYVHKTSTNYSHAGEPISHVCMGHFHQLTFAPSATINGSLKGYDEWARQMGFPAERAQQALMLVAPDHGIIARFGVHADD